MTIRFFCPRWGSEHLSWTDFFKKVKSAGYDGVELAIERGSSMTLMKDVLGEAKANGLEIIVQHYDTMAGDFQEHYDIYASWLEKIKGIEVLFVNSQTGKDYFTIAQNESLIQLATKFTSDTGIPVYHETHRNKFAFAAHITHEYLKRNPALLITLDASHWVNVAESYLEDQRDAMQLAIARAAHIHARVGHPEGPQVTDPRAPEWKVAVEKHLAWWDMVVANKTRLREERLTITPEFGPPPYLVTQPYTQQPITSQWDVNEYMMNLLKERYQKMRNQNFGATML